MAAGAAAGNEKQKVWAWRFDVLRALGFSISDSSTLASNPDCDLRLAEKLIKNGCTVGLAKRILL